MSCSPFVIRLRRQLGAVPRRSRRSICSNDLLSHRLFGITDVYLGSSAVKKDFRLRGLSFGAIWSRCVLRGFEFYSLNTVGAGAGQHRFDGNVDRELICKDNWDIRVDGWCR